jgi:hypothetical protein
MFSPSLDLFRRVVDPRVCRLTSELIKVSASPSKIYRVVLQVSRGHPAVSSVILKSIAPIWPDDPHGPDRELTFYTRLLPQMDVDHAHLYFAGVDEASQHRVIILEDIAPGYWFPLPTHVWEPVEADCVLRAYARLHDQGAGALPPEDERGWMWRMSLQRQEWEPGALLSLLDHLVSSGIWPSLPKAEKLITKTLAEMPHFADQPVTLLHNDVFPPNAALPVDLADEAILLDWEMVGWGMAELDLAFMFMQPFHGALLLNRTEALDYYWRHRENLQGGHRSVEERRAVQNHADALWALSLVPVAYRVVTNPHPKGSAPQRYWESMFGVLHDRLRSLCETI